MPKPDELLTPVEVAAILGVKVGTLATWRSTGRQDLAFVRVGRAIRYSPAALERYIERQSMSHTT